MSSDHEGDDIMEDPRFLSNTVRLHYYGHQNDVPTAYVIVEKSDDDPTGFHFVDGVSLTRELLVKGEYSLAEVYREVRVKNERLSFDMVVTMFVEVLDIVGLIDDRVSSAKPNYKRIQASVKKDTGLDVLDLIVYRDLKFNLEDGLDEYEEDEVLKLARKVDPRIPDFESLSEMFQGFEKIFGAISVIDDTKNDHTRFDEKDIVTAVAEFEASYANRKTGESRYANYSDVQSSITRHQTAYARYLEEDASRVELINAYRERLASIEDDEDDPVIMKDLIELNAVVVFRPQYNGITPNELDGLDIFNAAIATKYVPYIQYNDGKGQKYFKILSGDFDYESIGLSSTNLQTSGLNTIYAMIWLDDNGVSARNEDDNKYAWEDIVSSPTNSFYTIVYNLEEGFLEISVPNKTKQNQVSDIEEVNARFASSFIDLDISSVEDVKTKGYFDVYGVQVSEATFLHALLVNSTFYRYLYAEEKLRPFSYKHRMDIHFNGLFSYMGEQIKVISKDGTQLPFEYKSIAFSAQLREITDKEAEDVGVATPYVVRFGINGGARFDMIEEAREVIKVLLILYKQVQETYLSLYDNFFTEDDYVLIDSRHYTRVLISENDEDGGVQVAQSRQRVRELKERAPDLFIDGFAGICQNTGQPVIVENVDEWKAQTFDYHGQKLNRQVMPFPHDDPKWNFGCSNRIKPFPGVRQNTTLPNRDKYPEIPCCFKHDHISPGSVSLYNEVYNKQKKRATVIDPKKPISTNKIAKPGQTGFLPETLTGILSQYREGLSLPGEENDWKMVRMGIPISPSSIIHAALVAVMDREYASSRTDIYREDIAIKHRKNFLKLNLSLLAQENYDRTEEDIRKELENVNYHLDQERYIRAVEEYFNLNIFLFTLVGTDDVSIIVPHHKSFYVKISKPNRPTVLMLKHYGSITDAIDDPHTELIIDLNTRTAQSVSLFDAGVLGICQKLFDSTVGNVSWFQHQTRLVRKNEAALPIYPHLNFYNVIDFTSLFYIFRIGFGDKGESNLLGQYLDNFGKVRAFVVRYYPPVTKGEKKVFIRVTFFVPPTAPENAPRIISIEDLPDAPPVRVSELIETPPTSKVLDAEGRMVGIWYPYFDLIQGIYVPVRSDMEAPPSFLGLPEGPPNPYAKTTEQASVGADRYIRLKKILEFLLEIIEWLYEIHRRDTDGNPDPLTFYRRVFTVKEEKVDSVSYFNRDDVQRILPDVEDLVEAMKYITSVLKPTSDGRIELYSKVLGERIFAKIQEYDEKTSGEKPYIRTSIESFYKFADDFTPHQNNVIIIGSDNLTKWSSSRRAETSKDFLIKTKLDLSIASSAEPIIYQDVSGDFWLVQNSSSGSQNSALAIAKKWFEYRINIGAKAKALTDDVLPSHFVYVISSGQNLIAVEDNTNPEDVDFLHIIRYNEDMYGALLPL